MNFEFFAQQIEKQFMAMAEGELFVVDVDKEELWNLYLDSFPEGTNEIYKERREYDCQCCKQFVRNIGNVVTIRGNRLVSVWDAYLEGVDDAFKVVCAALSEKVTKAGIVSVFRHTEDRFGNRTTRQITDSGIIDWNHFYCSVPNKFVSANAASVAGRINSDVQVVERGLRELTLDSAEIVLELIDQNSLYRGEEFRESVQGFYDLKKEFEELDESLRNVFVWANSGAHGARIRNTAIGTLLQDISEGKTLNAAVASFESKVAPTNYKRTSAPITASMVKKAVEKIEDLGLEVSLQRRFATIEDISVNNVLFADRSVSAVMKDSLTNVLMQEVKESNKSYDKVEEIGIDDFINNVLPNVDSLEVLVKNKHTPNLVSLATAVQENSQNLFQWDNKFSWSYNGNITDSIKEKVKTAGGNVEGVLRTSLSWFNHDDLDIHVLEPNGNQIYFNRKRSSTSGTLDVDMNAGSGTTRDPVENIIWTDLNRMVKGDYKVIVHNYSQRESIDIGFTLEVEFAGTLHQFTYNRPVRDEAKVPVVTINFDGNSFKIKDIGKDITGEGISKDLWGIQTEKFQKVNSVMLSPNHWDDQTVGNKHFFFMLDGCVNPDDTRGIYNEFLRNDLREHRKVFEMLADKFKCQQVDNQLSGLGFSSTKRDKLVCRVKGNFTRTLKVKF